MAGGLGHDLAPPDVGDLVLAASHVTDADPGPDLDPGLDPGMVLLGLLDVPGLPLEDCLEHTNLMCNVCVDLSYDLP